MSPAPAPRPSTGAVIDPEVVAQLRRPLGVPGPVASLTTRERDVLALVAEGRTNAAIPRRLWLSERTVETHISGVIAKLGIAGAVDDHRRVLAVLAYLEATGRPVTGDLDPRRTRTRARPGSPPVS